MEETKKKKKMNKDVELQKIQIIAGNYQTWFNLGGSIVVGGLIGLPIAFLTLYYEHLISLLVYSFGLGIVYVALGVGATWFMHRRNNEHLEFIDGLLERIENGEALPSLVELRKQLRKEK
jgi:hypothetical protein